MNPEQGFEEDRQKAVTGVKDDPNPGKREDQESGRLSSPLASMDERPGDPASDFGPVWTAEQAAQWRRSQPPVSLAKVLGLQAAVGGVLVVAIGSVFGWDSAGKSVAWGWLAVLLPSILMAWGIRRPTPLAGLSLARFFAWEWAKLGLSVVLMLLAPWGVEQWSGLALLAGVILAVKAHWLALWWLTRRSRGLESKNDLNTED